MLQFKYNSNNIERENAMSWRIYLQMEQERQDTGTVNGRFLDRDRQY